MRFEFEYEIGEKYEESFECYFPEFDFLVDIPNEYHGDMEMSNQIYKTAKKSMKPEDVLHACLSDKSFKVVPKVGLMNEKPVVFFDLETTGTDVVVDQIVQIAITKRYVNGKTEKKVRYIKPTILIPKEAEDVHGISMETVATAPSFREVAKALRAFIDGCDLGGYNILKFDVPLLQEEFRRAGVMDWPQPGTKFADSMVIFHHFNPRTLEAAYQQYCGKTLEGAHDAGVDTDATVEILESQIANHDEIGSSVGDIHAFCTKDMVDFQGKLKRREDGEIVYTFGKHRGKRVLDERGFGEWMLKQSFSYNTKACVREILNPTKSEEVQKEIEN